MAEESNKHLAKVQGEFSDLKRITENALMLTVREALFSRLIATEGWSQVDAYVESHQPETKDKDSLYVMSSRTANKPRVKNEIARIKREGAEDGLKREERLGLALDGNRVRSRMALELYAIATSDAPELIRMKAWKMMGEMKHVDAFINSNSVAVGTSQPVGFGVKTDQGSLAAKEALIENIKKIIGSRSAERTIDVQVVPAKDETIEA